MPPVWSCMTFVPVASMARASTSESISASMIPMRSSSLRREIEALSVVVLPEPGELMRFSRKTPFSLSSARSLSASRSLLSKMLSLTSSILKLSITCTSFQ